MVALTFSAYSQLFTNYNVTLPVSGTYILNLPVNTVGTLTVNGQWFTTSTVTNDSKNGIFADILSSSVCTINGITAMNVFSEYENDNILTNATSGLITKNWTYVAPITSDTEVFLSTTRLMYSISGGNWYERTDTSNVVNIAYSYTAVPEPSTIALIGMSIATLLATFKRKI